MSPFDPRRAPEKKSRVRLHVENVIDLMAVDTERLVPLRDRGNKAPILINELERRGVI